VILAAPFFEILCGKKQTDRQKNTPENLTPTTNVIIVSEVTTFQWDINVYVYLLLHLFIKVKHFISTLAFEH